MHKIGDKIIVQLSTNVYEIDIISEIDSLNSFLIFYRLEKNKGLFGPGRISILPQESNNIMKGLCSK